MGLCTWIIGGPGRGQGGCTHGTLTLRPGALEAGYRRIAAREGEARAGRVGGREGDSGLKPGSLMRRPWGIISGGRGSGSQSFTRLHLLL